MNAVFLSKTIILKDSFLQVFKCLFWDKKFGKYRKWYDLSFSFIYWSQNYENITTIGSDKIVSTKISQYTEFHTGTILVKYKLAHIQLTLCSIIIIDRMPL